MLAGDTTHWIPLSHTLSPVSKRGPRWISGTKTIAKWGGLGAAPGQTDRSSAMGDRPKLPEIRELLRIIDAAMSGLLEVNPLNTFRQCAPDRCDL